MSTAGEETNEQCSAYMTRTELKYTVLLGELNGSEIILLRAFTQHELED